MAASIKKQNDIDAGYLETYGVFIDDILGEHDIPTGFLMAALVHLKYNFWCILKHTGTRQFGHTVRGRSLAGFGLDLCQVIG